MSTEVPLSDPSSRPLKVSVTPGPGIEVVDSGDPSAAAVQVPVASVPVTELHKDATRGTLPMASAAAATPGVPTPSAIDTTALPDDPAVLKQMIAELIQALRRERHNRADVE